MNNSRSYENKLIFLFFLTWGFQFLDRMALMFILPVIVPSLDLTHTHVGMLNLSFTLAWGISAILFSAIADKTGNLKRWLLIVGFTASVFAASCVFATSYGSLLVLRTLVGITAGPFSTFVMASLGKSISGERLGLGVGIVNCGVVVVGLTFGPVFLTQLVAATTWQMSFLVASIPGFILMTIVWMFMKPIPNAVREPVSSIAGDASSPKINQNMFLECWSYRNFRICFFLAMTHMAGYWLMMLFASLYWTEVAGLDVQTMGFLLGAMGFVNIISCIVLPKLSDIYGRKNIMLISYVFCAIPSLAMFLLPGSGFSMVAYVLFAGVPGALGVFWINLLPMETLPPYLTSTGISIPMAMGEFIGGGVITAIGAVIADMYGLPAMMVLASVGMAISFVLCLGLKETAPRAIARREAKLASMGKVN